VVTALKEAEADAASLDAGGEVSRHKREEDARKTSKFVTFLCVWKVESNVVILTTSVDQKLGRGANVWSIAGS